MKGIPSEQIRDPKDPRHGTVRGAVAHHAIGDKACSWCRRAKRLYEAQRRMADAPEKKVPALGSRRRVNALRALGWSKPFMCRELELSPRSMDRIINPAYESITRPIADKIDALYRRLCMAPPPQGPDADRTRTWARKAGCVPPLAWDDIDHDEAPVVVEDDMSPKERRDAERLDWLELADSEHRTVTYAAEGLGLSREGLNVWCRTRGHMDLYWRLVNRDPETGENQHTAA